MPDPEASDEDPERESASRGGPDDSSGPAHDEQALLAAFDRLSPQGSLRWGFDDAMRRVAQPETDVAAEPFPGLPDDLWERGRSARIGQRFVGDVAGVMAELLASDARAVAAAVAAGANSAAWDALRYLAARVEALETAADPVGLEAAELPIRPPDLGGWATRIEALLGSSDPSRAVLVGECGNGALTRRLEQAGWRIEGVEPRASSAWTGLAADGDRTSLTGDRTSRPSDGTSRTGDGTGPTIVVAEVLDHLRTVPPDARTGVVLAGCVDRLGLGTKVGLLDEAVRVTKRGGSVVVLTTDQSAWDDALEPPTRDLAPGRPLHPETWALLLRRSGLVDVARHGQGPGGLHAVAGRVAP